MPPDPLKHSARTIAPKARPAVPRTVAGWLRLFAWPLLLLALHGCSDLSRSSIDSIKLAMHHRAPVEWTAAEVAARPYFQLQASSADGNAVLVLGNVDGAREAWYGAGQVVIFIERGRIVKTIGLRQNLDGVQLPTDDPFARGLQTLNAPTRYRMRRDWSPGYRYDVPVDATLTPAGHEQISILGSIHPVLRVDEQLSAPSLDYRTTNRYWVDPQDGFIWKSEQHVAPGLTLQLLQLRPYRGTQP